MHAALAAKLPCRMEEEAAFKAFAAQPNLHEQIFNKVAPNIFGHADIKKAVACLLFGGARKVRSCLLSARLSRGPWHRAGQCLVAATALLLQCLSKVFSFPASSLLPLAACTGHAKKCYLLLGHFTAQVTCHSSFLPAFGGIPAFKSQKIQYSCSASLPGPRCHAACGVAHILLLCKGTW